MKRFGSAAWNGGLREGKGSVSTESRALENYPYSFFTRYGKEPGTNPEELLGAAHAACFTMSFVRMLGMASSCPNRWTANRTLSSKRMGTAFPSPRSISPSRRKYRALTGTRFSRSQQRQRPAALFPN